MRIWLAEFVGTFALVFAGVGALAAGASLVGVALAFGLAVGIMIAAVGPISAAHFNPAVTLGFLALRRIRLADVPLYWSAQLAGATLAALLLRSWYGGERLAAVGWGATVPARGVSVLGGIGIEVVLTFFLMFTIATIVIRKHAMDGLYIGGAVALGALAGGPLTGASMNPARSFGPALVGGVWELHWLYWLAPVAGALLAALLAPWLWSAQEDPLVTEETSVALPPRERMHAAERGEVGVEG